MTWRAFGCCGAYHGGFTCWAPVSPGRLPPFGVPRGPTLATSLRCCRAAALTMRGRGPVPAAAPVGYRPPVAVQAEVDVAGFPASRIPRRLQLALARRHVHRHAAEDLVVAVEHADPGAGAVHGHEVDLGRS